MKLTPTQVVVWSGPPVLAARRPVLALLRNMTPATLSKARLVICTTGREWAVRCRVVFLVLVLVPEVCPDPGGSFLDFSVLTLSSFPPYFR